MELGQWVEFNSTVIKQDTATGNTPAIRQLSRVRKGMVVGIRNVYDVTLGNPPVLTNPQPVLIVAVSLHRQYRVFPQLAQECDPPRKRQKRQLNPTLTLTHAAPVGRLHSVNDDDIEMLVADQINLFIGKGDMFTAYDVTMAIRQAHPTIKIKHDDVRPLVHQAMEAAVVSGVYEREAATFGTDTATRYLPTQ